MITAVCLLAGFSTRMGQLKQHVKLGDKTFLERILCNLKKNSEYVEKIIMVGQASDFRSQAVSESLHISWITNPAPEDGPLSSIKLALRHIEPESAMLLWPVDHPLVSNKTVAMLCREHCSNPDKIIVPSIDNRRGHPTIFPASLKAELSSISLEEGAKKLLQLYPERIAHLVTTDVWVRKNLNNPQMLEEAEQYLQAMHQS